MLVLSRQKSQQIKFPDLDVTVEIMDIKGSRVHVGIDAPMEVRVLRGELKDHGPRPGSASEQVFRLSKTQRHELRNALHELSLMLHVYRKRQQREPGQSAADEFSPEQLFAAIIERIEALSSHQALASSNPAPKQTPASRLPEGKPRGGTAIGRALVVDDDNNERELLAGFLKMCGYEITTAADGVEAFDQLQHKEQPEFILLDMHMPNCDGSAFLKKFRGVEDWAPIHVFVVSGASPTEFGLDSSTSYTHWFEKPLDPRLVVEKLSQIERLG